MTVIRIDKVLRDCNYNRERTRGQRYIYDYHVFIDGERRASFNSQLHHTEFKLIDMLGRPINFRGATRLSKADMAVFNSLVEGALERGLIPTLTEIEIAKAERLHIRVRAEREAAARRAIEQKRAAGPDLYEAIDTLMGYLGSWVEAYNVGDPQHAAYVAVQFAMTKARIP